MLTDKLHEHLVIYIKCYRYLNYKQEDKITISIWYASRGVVQCNRCNGGHRVDS